MTLTEDEAAFLESIRAAREGRMFAWLDAMARIKAHASTRRRLLKRGLLERRNGLLHVTAVAP
jgi:hypothetical protein